jgi:serine/threonine protein kinase
MQVSVPPMLLQGYMAPELLLAGGGELRSSGSRPHTEEHVQFVQHPACALDIWSLGVVTYRMLTGRKPFPEMLPGTT